MPMYREKDGISGSLGRCPKAAQNVQSKRKDAAELWDAAENLDVACEGCHRSYWYPGETPEFYRKLDSELRRLGNSSDTKQP